MWTFYLTPTLDSYYVVIVTCCFSEFGAHNRRLADDGDSTDLANFSHELNLN
jgi:hypothetical protein